MRGRCTLQILGRSDGQYGWGNRAFKRPREALDHYSPFRMACNELMPEWPVMPITDHSGIWIRWAFCTGPTVRPLAGSRIRYGPPRCDAGGVRAAAFVHSPLLPTQVRGTWFNGTLHLVDWLPTFLHLAGATSRNASVLDGLSQWQALYTGKKK